MKYNPWDYQRHAEQWIIDHPYCGLFLEMGLGKTVTTLSAIKRLIEAGEVKRALVIAPLRVAATVWKEEAAKWDHLKGLRVNKVLGGCHERTRQFERDADIYVINRENTVWLMQYCIRNNWWPFDMLVLDELSSFKSAKSERFRALKQVRPKFKRVVGLTGTPAPNGLMDLWSQMYLLDAGLRLEKTLGGYRARYFTEGKRNAQVVFNWVPKPEAPAAIYNKISDICMSMTAKDYLTLPDQIDRIVEVNLTDKAQQAYDQLERDLVLPLKDETITAANAAVLVGKLLQLSNGAIYYSEDHSYQVVHDDKLDALEELIEAANGQPVLVYYSFQHDCDRIRERIPQAHKLSDPEDVDRWNRGEIPVLLAHPDSAGHGLNMQRGGHIIIWFGLTWSLEKYQQANARLHRQGQTCPVTVFHLVTKDTVDERVLQVLSGKETRQDALINAVKAMVRRCDNDS